MGTALLTIGSFLVAFIVGVASMSDRKTGKESPEAALVFAIGVALIVLGVRL